MNKKLGNFRKKLLKNIKNKLEERYGISFETQGCVIRAHQKMTEYNVYFFLSSLKNSHEIKISKIERYGRVDSSKSYYCKTGEMLNIISEKFKELGLLNKEELDIQEIII